MHSYHHLDDGHPNRPVLYDDCSECEARGEDVYHAITTMDNTTFERAYKRAAKLQLDGLPNMQKCEAKVLRALIAMNLQMERRGYKLGELPPPVVS